VYRFFSKDGVGWRNGSEPKLVKGPDIFLRVIQQLKSRYKIHVLLSAPARGYIKSGLESLGIPYQHFHLKKYWDIVRLYQALDLYLVTSREEGGPKAMLESLACGIPLVTTRVGMVPDVIIDKYNGLSVEMKTLTDWFKALLNYRKTLNWWKPSQSMV
jgi:glycosyltransferase involved in cell wall biosynthesis